MLRLGLVLPSPVLVRLRKEIPFHFSSQWDSGAANERTRLCVCICLCGCVGVCERKCEVECKIIFCENVYSFHC